MNGSGDVTRIVLTLSLALTAGVGSRAIAQHATAFDIEDGGRAFESSCAACHGPDGNLIAGIDFGRGVFRRPLTDDEIAGIILNGIPSTPMPATPGMSEEQALHIVAYLRSMPESFTEAAAAGNPARGRAIVTDSGDCLDCHTVAGRGSRLGPDLSRIGLERRAAEIERSLLEPEAEVEPENRFYEVTPKQDEPVAGRLLNQDTFTVQLMDADERLRSFRKSDLDAFGFVESPMPSYRDTLDAQALADVVSYLVSLRGQPTP
jgi:putative heme-binding domain-containing protein